MELLKKLLLILILPLVLISSDLFANHAIELPGLVLRGGLHAEVIYDSTAEGALAIGESQQMVIDPITGELYFGNVAIPPVEDFIFIFNPNTGATRKFPYYGSGMAFSKDGSAFYFGLEDLMLGVWYRDTNEYRKFSILPGVRSVKVVDDGSEKGRLLAGNSDYGKNILGVDTVWEIDQGDGYYQAVMRLSEGSAAVGEGFQDLYKMTADAAGNIQVMTGQGKILIRQADGTYIEGNSALVASSGLMHGGLSAGPSGIVFLQDTSSAEIYAHLLDGSQVLLGYGDAFKQTNNVTDGDVVSNGTSIYAINAQDKILRIYAANGSSIQSALETTLGTATLNGNITDVNNVALAGVNVRLRNKSISPVISDANGDFQFSVPAGLYHILATLPNYADTHTQVTTTANQSSDLSISMASYLPAFLPPGLVADIIATKDADSIEGSSDVTFDKEGNLYSLNHSNGTITKTILDPVTRAVVETFIIVKGGGLTNAWFVIVDHDFNIYTSSSNSGLLRLPQVTSADDLITLTVDPLDLNTVRDQNGVNRMVSLITDIDGGVVMSNGDIMITSGAGGSIIDGFPDGTIDAIVRYNPTTGAQTIFSRGIPLGGTESVFVNPDVLKVDKQDRLYVTNRLGNVVRVDTSGNAELIWPGDGVGYPEGLSSYTAFNADDSGNMFLKGVDSTGDAVLRMLDPADDHKLLTVASGLYPSSGFGGFEFDEDGRSIILSEWDFVLRIRTTDGRTIAENIINPPGGGKAFELDNSKLSGRASSNARSITLSSNRKSEPFPSTDANTVKLPAQWAFSSGPGQEITKTSTGRSFGKIDLIILVGVFILLVLMRLRRALGN